MGLINNLTNPGSDIYYSQDFRNIFEDHLNYILNTKQLNITTKTVDPNTAARFAGDFRGLMLEMNIAPELHWFNMRLNGYTSTSDYDGSKTTVDVIDPSVISSLMSSYKTVRKN